MKVFLYAGQGSQYVGMGRDIYDAFREYREAVESARLPFDCLKLMNEGPADMLNDTKYTQPCFAVFALGVTSVLNSAGIYPDAACGLSLGEYSALYAAGVWDADTYLDLLCFRGSAMAKACEGLTYSMSAILGAKSSEVETACEAVKEQGFIALANYNCPGQYVVCGEEKAVAALEIYMQKNYRARASRLNTTSPFHTRLMKKAGDALRKKFKDIEFQTPEIPVAMNVTGKFLKENDDLKELLELQVSNSVRFEDDIKTLILAGADEFIEIGPGKVLTGLTKKTARNLGVKIKNITIQNADDLKTCLGVYGNTQ